MATSPMDKLDPDKFHERRRLRARRKRRRAYIRSIYLLPSMATLGNAACGFAAIYISGLDLIPMDPLTQWLVGYNPLTHEMEHRFIMAAYLIFAAMFFDAIDGRLARFTRHTTDFGGQLDSLADAISFGVAPALLMMQLLKLSTGMVPFALSRAIWAVGAIYMCCAVIRLARFNVSNQHGEQHHFSFLGLPSPAAAGVVASLVLLHQTLFADGSELWKTSAGFWTKTVLWTSVVVYWAIPVITLLTGLLMVSTIRYPHLVNRYIRGKRSLGRLMTVIVGGLAILILHRYLLGVAMLVYVILGLWAWIKARGRSGRALEAAAVKQG
jgi:CDP-diacylglycerol--serine O-phosphatidyltransferase